MDGFKRAGPLTNVASAQNNEVVSVKHSNRRVGLADYVYAFVKDMILDGQLGPCEAIQVELLSKKLDVSRQPIMEALKRLALEGFVLILPQVGCQVRHYSVEEITDFYRLFAKAEALIAELLAERATSADIEMMTSISEQIGMLRTSNMNPSETGVQYRQLNRRLHFEMRRASHSLPVAEVVETLGDRSDFFVASTGHNIFAQRLDRAHAQHEAIIAAAKRRDPLAARQVMRQHILETAEHIRMKQ
ncbi:GntR family transcriptional regulator [Ochrobactrum sp. Q0168]|uniref:GntR family transcriptional regulator n=1 Tax=Ochrobactrum sp. Q0168 TaxID=2793241 RepID=UPI0018EA7FA0|nr:GntR family transcriptional regulator [Ochrobactrum sp. Q0168]